MLTWPNRTFILESPWGFSSGCSDSLNLHAAPQLNRQLSRNVLSSMITSGAILALSHHKSPVGARNFSSTMKLNPCRWIHPNPEDTQFELILYVMQKSCSQLSSDSTMGFSYPSLYPNSSLDFGPTPDNNNQASPNQVLGQSHLSYKHQARSGSGYNSGSYGMPTTHLSFSPTPIQNSFPQALPSPLHYGGGQCLVILRANENWQINKSINQIKFY
jgi:hypothetical protein